MRRHACVNSHHWSDVRQRDVFIAAIFDREVLSDAEKSILSTLFAQLFDLSFEQGQDLVLRGQNNVNLNGHEKAIQASAATLRDCDVGPCSFRIMVVLAVQSVPAINDDKLCRCSKEVGTQTGTILRYFRTRSERNNCSGHDRFQSSFCRSKRQ